MEYYFHNSIFSYLLAPGDYPTFVEVHPHTEHSVLVKWRGVTTHFDEESLDGYIVSSIIINVLAI